ncbi:MAG: MipA/OmpV family protein [Pseudomonadota bacterium]
MTSSSPIVRVIVSASFVCSSLGIAVAQQTPPPGQGGQGGQGGPGRPPAQPDGWSVQVGGGFLFSPTYLGDDDYQLRALPNIQVTYGDDFFASVQTGIGYNLLRGGNLRTGAWRAGPIMRIAFGREAEGAQPFVIAGENTQDLQGLGDINTTFELGGFFAYETPKWQVQVEAREGLNGHEGFVADITLNRRGRFQALGGMNIFSVGPRVRFVDGEFNSAYFDVNGAQSLASGLPVFDTGGGLQTYGVGANIVRPIGSKRRIIGVVTAGYDRIGGDAGDAPLVRLRGSRNQASIGFFLSYRL